MAAPRPQPPSLLARILALLHPRSRRDPLGPQGERAAARLLQRAGYTILARNVRVRAGEADLVCRAPDRRTIVIVEVKARRRTPTASARANAIRPEESVHAAKRRKLLAISRSLARSNGWTDRPVRIDVVAVEWPLDPRGRPTKPTLRHYINAVTA